MTPSQVTFSLVWLSVSIFKFEASVDDHNHEMMIGHDDISIKMFETMDFLPRTFESHGVTA